MNLKYYLTGLFEPVILFGFLPALLGILAASHYSTFNLWLGVLAAIGIVLAHMSVNFIDSYEDYSSGLDKDTVKTKFSGGRSLAVALIQKNVKLKHLMAIGIITFVIAISIGAYLIYRNPLLLPFAVVGALSVALYAKFLSKVPFMSEPLTALNFTLIPLGCFIAAGGPVGALGLFAFAAIAVGIQVGICVVVNYLPDREPDRKHGRRNVVVILNNNKKTAAFYLLLEAIAYLLVVYGVVLGAIPASSLVVLISIPIVLTIACEIVNYKNPKAFERVMGNAVLTELAFILILVIAFA